MNYQVSDIIIRIKNAALAKRKKVVLPYSKMSRAISTILVKENYLTDVKEEEQEGRKVLVAGVRYEKRIPVLTDLRVISKPSLRVYDSSKNMRNVQRKSLGVAIVSTSQGIMTTEEARKKGIGGEVLFKIW